jgi:hypothetical protein
MSVSLAKRAVERELKEEVSHVIQTLSRLHGLAVGAWSMTGARGECPEQPLKHVNRHKKVIDSEWPWEGVEEKEFAQFWFVTAWLAEKLVEHGEHVLLVCEANWCWCREGCGYAIEDDFAFLDEEESDV